MGSNGFWAGVFSGQTTTCEIAPCLFADYLEFFHCEQVLVIVILVLIASFVMVFVCPDLSADLACREELCMDVPVYGIGGKRGDDCCEIASSYVLCRGSYHSCCRYGARHSYLSLIHI